MSYHKQQKYMIFRDAALDAAEKLGALTPTESSILSGFNAHQEIKKHVDANAYILFGVDDGELYFLSCPP